MNTGELLATQMDYTRDWTSRLLADFLGDDWTLPIGPGLAHATWTCGHLAVSQDVLVHRRVLGRGIIDDSFAQHFPIGAAVPATSEHEYPPIADILVTMRDVHEQTLAAVRAMSDELLLEPAYAADGKSPHPHYKDKLGAVSHAARHEAFHAGQIAVIRRLLGKQFLR